MNQSVKTPKSVYTIFGLGIAVGVLSMSAAINGGVTKAFASPDATPRTISSTSSESLAELKNLDNSFSNLAEFAEPAVVDIQSTSGRSMNSDGSRRPAMGGEGSGFIFRPDGYIVTNDHVVGGFDNVKVILKDGREFPGKVTRAEDSDIAIVKIDAKDLPTLQFADSTKVRPGQISMAVGAPFGFTNSVTVGHVSALSRETQIQNRFYPTLIQTDTSINMGNSGGPLINVDGQVIGINTAIFSPTGSSAGIGFAIPSNEARLIAETLIKDGKVTRSMIGIAPADLKEYEKAKLKVDGGAVVKSVSSDGPAAAAGIKVNDVVVKVGATPIGSQMDLRDAMLKYAPGTTVPVEVVRDGNHLTVTTKLSAYKRPAQLTAPELNQDNSPFNDFQMPGDPNRFVIPKDFLKQFQKGFGQGNGSQGNGSQGDVPPLRQGKAKLGVQFNDLSGDLRSQFHIPNSAKGAVVLGVGPGSVADNLGIQPGDLIVSFDGKPIMTAKDLTVQMGTVKWGDTRRIRYVRYSDNGVSTIETTVQFR